MSKDNESVKESIKNTIEESDVSLNKNAEEYYNNLDESEDMYGEDGVSTQAKYILSNIDTTDKESIELKRKLENIVGIENDDDEQNNNELTMYEFEEISTGFESFTEDKVRREKLVTVEDFKKYSHRTGYDLNKVFCSNPWVDSVVTENVHRKIEEANKVIEFQF